jgi:hypothetical protein
VKGGYVAKAGSDGYLYYLPTQNSGADTLAKLQLHRGRMERLVNEAVKKWRNGPIVDGLKLLLTPSPKGERICRITTMAVNGTSAGAYMIPGTDPWIWIGNLATGNYLDVIHEIAHQAYNWNGTCPKNTCENDWCHTPDFYSTQRSLMFLAADTGIMPRSTPHDQPYDPWSDTNFKALSAGKYYRRTVNGACVA